MRAGEAVVFISFMLFGLVVVVSVLYSRHRKQQLLHEERMAALEKGTAIPMGREPAPWSPRVYLLRGLIWAFSGAAIAVAFYGVAVTSQRQPSAENAAWRARNISRDLEIPLDQAKQMVDKDQATRREGPPTGLALFGLIPFGVGLAYLIFYYTGVSGQDNGRELSPPPRV